MNNSSSDDCRQFHYHTNRLTDFRVVNLRYIFPWQLALGVATNVLNIIVFNRREMRSHTNRLLSALSLTDMLILLFYFPVTLQAFPALAGSPTFVRSWWYSY